MRNLDPARAKWIRFRMGLLCGIDGARPRRLRLERVPRAGRGRRDVEGDGGEPAAAAPPRRAEARRASTTATALRSPRASRCRASARDVVEMLRGIEGQNAAGRALIEFSTRIARRARPRPDRRPRRSSRRKRRFVWLKRRVTAEEAQAVRDLGDPKKQLGRKAREGPRRRRRRPSLLPGPRARRARCSASSRPTASARTASSCRSTRSCAVAPRRCAASAIARAASSSPRARPTRARFAGHDVQLAIDEGDPARRRARARRRASARTRRRAPRSS